MWVCVDEAGTTYCVSIGNVNSAQVACILIGKVFDYVGVQLPDVSLHWRHPRGAWRNTVSSRGIISSVHGLGCMVWKQNSCKSHVEPSWGTTTVTQNGQNNIDSSLGESINIRQLAATTALHLTTAMPSSSISAPNIASASCITHVECQCIQTFDGVVECLVCCALHSRDLGHLLVLALTGVSGRLLG